MKPAARIIPVLALLLPPLALSCGGKKQVRETTPWIRVTEETPRPVLPHAVEAGRKQSHVWVRDGGTWRKVGTFPYVGRLLTYDGGRRALLHVGGTRVLGLSAGAPPVELRGCASAQVDPGGASVSCVTCDAGCAHVELRSYRDPAAPPALRRIPLPAPPCRGSVMAVQEPGEPPRGAVEWFDEAALFGERPGAPPRRVVQVSCQQPRECVYYELRGDALHEVGRRAERCGT